MPGNIILSYELHCAESGFPLSYFPGDLARLDFNLGPETFRVLHLADVIGHRIDVLHYLLHELQRVDLPGTEANLWQIKQHERQAMSDAEHYRSLGPIRRSFAGNLRNAQARLDAIRSDPRLAFYLDLYDAELHIDIAVVPRAREFTEDLWSNAPLFYRIDWAAANDRLKELYGEYALSLDTPEIGPHAD